MLPYLIGVIIDRMSYADEFIKMLDSYHLTREVWDDELNIEILKNEIEILENPVNKFPPRDLPYFSPSSANSCPRELYMKVKGAKRDIEEKQAHQSRWQKIGSMFGGLIQNELLFIEKHYEKSVGDKPPFIPARTNQGHPFWEGFAKECKLVEHNGHKFYLYGTLDGKLIHSSGQAVGLEIKSKQTSSAQTGHYKMKSASEDHQKQVVCYSIMYGINDYIIFYGNLSKKGWVMTADDYAKNPDIRAFDVHITQQQRGEVLDNFAYILDCVKNDTPPALDLSRWSFNNYKKACALDLSDEEYLKLKVQVKNCLKGNLPDYIKTNYFNAFEYIKEVRNNG